MYTVWKPCICEFRDCRSCVAEDSVLLGHEAAKRPRRRESSPPQWTKVFKFIFISKFHHLPALR